MTSEALHTKDPEIMCKTLKIIQKLVSTHPEVGEDLVPYYKALFPMLNLFINKTSTLELWQNTTETKWTTASKRT